MMSFADRVVRRGGNGDFFRPKQFAVWRGARRTPDVYTDQLTALIQQQYWEYVVGLPARVKMEFRK